MCSVGTPCQNFPSLAQVFFGRPDQHFWPVANCPGYLQGNRWNFIQREKEKGNCFNYIGYYMVHQGTWLLKGKLYFIPLDFIFLLYLPILTVRGRCVIIKIEKITFIGETWKVLLKLSSPWWYLPPPPSPLKIHPLVR